MPDAQVLAELSASTQVGELREIGRGAAATVYLARQPQFDRAVAVKVLNAPLLDDKSLRRFARERQALGRVGQHPNIVSVHDSGTTPSGYAYLVMDYCPGGSLAARLPGQPLTAAEATDVGVKLASALAWAHAATMIHRDIKPANILLTSLGQPVLADFGIAAIEIGELSVTLHESLTPIHAAPEVLLNGGGDPRSDVWSLASTVYTLVSGRPPFAADGPESLLALLHRVMESDLPVLRTAGSGPLFAALSRALTKDPALRTQTAAAFGAELQQSQRESGLPVTTFLTGTPAGAGSPPAATPAPPAASTGTPSTPPLPGAPPPGLPLPPIENSPPARSRRALVGGIVGVVLLLAVAAVVLALTRGGGSTRVAARRSGSAATPTLAPSAPSAPSVPLATAATATPPSTSVSPTAGATPAATASVDPSGPALPAQPITRGSPFGAGPLPYLPAVTANAFDLTQEAVAAGKGGALPTHLYTRDLVIGKGAALSAGYSGGFAIRETEYNYRTGEKSPVLDWAAAGGEPGLPAHARVDYLDLDSGSLDPGPGMVGMKPGGRREIVAPFGPGAAYTYLVDYLGHT